MRTFTATTPLDAFVGGYGPAWKRGLLSEHVDLFLAAGGTLRTASSGSGRQWALVPLGKGMEAVPVVCSELVEIYTEDGKASSRCGAPAHRLGACETHAEEIEAYMAMSEAERAHWERSLDGAY